jgi:glycosyltransferase involved in cell wall biosynthesis
MNLPGRKFDPYHRFLYGSLDRLIVVTRYLARQAAGQLPIAADRIRTIHNGSAVPDPADAARVAAIKREWRMEGRFVVGLLGRISHYKGQHLLIEAVDSLVREGRDVSAWIVGEPFEPEYLESLKADVVARGLSDRIRFHGFHPHPHELYPCFDAVVLTTRNETFGMVLVEAMHAGVAVVGSAEGGVPEIIDDGVNGLLFDTFDSSALARALSRLESDPEFRAGLAAAGRQKARAAFERDTQYRLVLDELRATLRERAAAGTRRAG